MDEITFAIKLLEELRVAQDLLVSEQTRLLYEAVPAEVKQRCDEITNQFSEKISLSSQAISEQEEKVKKLVLENGATVKGEHLMAVYSKRVSWDGKKLDGMMALIPQLSTARSESASVSIRVIK